MSSNIIKYYLNQLKISITGVKYSWTIYLPRVIPCLPTPRFSYADKHLHFIIMFSLEILGVALDFIKFTAESKYGQTQVVAGMVKSFSMTASSI